MSPHSSSPIHTLDALKRAGLLGTSAQVAVLDYLQQAEHGHFGAEEIHRQIARKGERMNLSTTYRVLNQLVGAGFVANVPLGKHHSLYELNTGKVHDHLVCVVCGRVEEFSDGTINRRRAAIAKEFGLRFVGKTLALRGVCADCAAHAHPAGPRVR
ncbi:Fur family transcriptional regulator [Paraburkholderia hospita]|jgi:Fur family ferric uptake transcriptional regulator|uniref:Fur family transcriptional regulator n=1 Tax=Paraburkholderia hospita TaxID=169430 RepID=UPI000B34128B|nr:Fur family transcriptional regulator [Paraburkholderia hospita]OUL79140.1 Fur family transcriptional regulator [Paraburkholderia hospita]